MGNTNYISDALNIANRAFGRPVEDDHAAFLANTAVAYMWKRYDWRQTIAALPPFYLIPLVQDYGAPFYAAPLDFSGLKTANLIQLSANPPAKKELRIIRNLREDHAQGFTRAIGYNPEQRAFRLFPRPPANIGASNYLVDGSYKKVAPVVTATSLQNTLIPWDDQYLNEFITALRWAALSTADDQRAANKKAELDVLLEAMAANEGLDLGDQVVAPSSPLVGGIPSGFLGGMDSGFF